VYLVSAVRYMMYAINSTLRYRLVTRVVVLKFTAIVDEDKRLVIW